MKRLQTLDIHFASDYPGNRLLEKRVITIPAEVEACEITHMTTDEGARNVRYSTYGNPTRIIMDNSTSGIHTGRLFKISISA